MSREPYAVSDEYILYPLADIDKDNHVELQRQINGDGTLFLMPKIKDMMWDASLSNENSKLYSIYEKNGDYCGCIELQKYKTDTPEIGLNLVETKRNQGIAAKVVKLLVQTVCDERDDIEYFLIRIMSNNPHSRYVFEKMGAVPIGEEEHPYVALMNRLKTTLAQDTVNEIQGTVKELMVDNDEEEFVYRYKLMPDVFD